jgi:hypothetical protein
MATVAPKIVYSFKDAQDKENWRNTLYLLFGYEGYTKTNALNNYFKDILPDLNTIRNLPLEQRKVVVLSAVATLRGNLFTI